MHAAGDDEPAWPQDAVEVGRVMDAWGIKGAIKVKPFAHDPQALFSSRHWFLQPPEDTPVSSSNLPRALRISSAHQHGEFIIAQSPGVADRNAAEALRGSRVFVSRDSFPTPADDEYYWVDLIGLEVVNREGQCLGVVGSLLDTGPHSVLCVRADGGAERLIPFVFAHVDEVCLAERRIRVDWGLDY